jgi:hypothetical protein
MLLCIDWRTDLAEFWKADVMPNIDKLTLKPKIDVLSRELGPSAGRSVFVFGDGAVKSGAESSGGPSGGERSAVSIAEEEEKLRRYSRVLTRAELELLLVQLPQILGIKPQSRHSNRYCAGLLGFPNGSEFLIVRFIYYMTNEHVMYCSG